MGWDGSKLSPTSLREVKNINHKHAKFWDYTQFVPINFIIPPHQNFLDPPLLEAKDQGHNAQVFSEKIVFGEKIASFSWNFNEKEKGYDIGSFLTNQKIVLSSSRGQSIFED